MIVLCYLGLAFIANLLRKVVAQDPEYSMRYNLTIDSIVRNDLLRIRLPYVNEPVTKSWERWMPDFEKHNADNHPVETVPERSYCLEGTKLINIIETEEGQTYGLNLKDKQVVLHNLSKGDGTASTKAYDFTVEGESKILFSRLYPYNATTAAAFRLYVNENSKIRFYDSLQNKVADSAYQMPEDLSKLTPVTLFGEDALWHGFVAKPGVTLQDPLNLLKVFKTDYYLTFNRWYPEPVEEILLDLGAAVKEANLFSSEDKVFNPEYMNILMHNQVSSKGAVLNADSVVIGGFLKNPPDGKRLYRMINCLIGQPQMDCKEVYTWELNSKEYLLMVDHPTNSNNILGARAVFVTPPEALPGLFTTRTFQLNISVAKSSFAPPHIERQNFIVTELPNARYPPEYRLEPRLLAPGLVALIDPSTKNLEYLEEEFARKDWPVYASLYRTSLGFTEKSLPIDTIHVRRTQIYSSTAVLIVPEGTPQSPRHCLYFFSNRSTHHIEIDTASYANSTELKMYYFNRTTDGKLNRSYDILTLSYTDSISNLERTDIPVTTLYQTEGRAVRFEADRNLVRGPTQQLNVLSPSSDFISLNTNKIRYFSLATRKELSAERVVGTLDRVVDLSSNTFYYQCHNELGRDIIVSCLKSSTFTAGYTDAVQFDIYGDWTLAVVVNQNIGKTALLCLNPYAIDTAKEFVYELPTSSKLHRLGVNSNYVVVFFTTAEQDLQYAVLDLLNLTNRYTKPLGVTGVTSIDHYRRTPLIELQFSAGTRQGFTVFKLPKDYLGNRSTYEAIQDGFFPTLYESESVLQTCQHRDGRNVSLLSDGKVIWTKKSTDRFKALFSVMMNLWMDKPINEMYCNFNNTDYILLRAGRDLVSLKLTDEVAPKRYWDRKIFKLEVDINMVFFQDNQIFVQTKSSSGSSRYSMVALNHNVFSFLAEDLESQVTFEFKGQNSQRVEVQIPVAKITEPKEKPVDLTRFGVGGYTANVGNKDSFEVNVTLNSEKGLEGHFWRWRLEGSKKSDLITVHNRFTYSSTIEIEGWQIVDYMSNGDTEAFLVKNKTHYCLAFRNFTGGLVIGEVEQVNNTIYEPQLLAVSSPSNRSYFNPRVSIWVNKNYLLMEVHVIEAHNNYTDTKMKITEYTPERGYYVKAYGLGQSMVFGYVQPYFGAVFLHGRLPNNNVNISMFTKGVSQFSIAGSKDCAVLVMQDRKTKQISGWASRLDSKDINSMLWFPFEESLAASSTNFPIIECGPGPMQDTMVCVFAGSVIKSYLIRVGKPNTVEKIMDHHIYKGAEITQVLMSPQGDYFIAAWKRPFTTFEGLEDPESGGVLYYSLKKNTVGTGGYASGGLNREELLSQGVLLSDKMVAGPKNTLIFTRQMNPPRVFTITTPSILAKGLTKTEYDTTTISIKTSSPSDQQSPTTRTAPNLPLEDT